MRGYKSVYSPTSLRKALVAILCGLSLLLLSSPPWSRLASGLNKSRGERGQKGAYNTLASVAGFLFTEKRITASDGEAEDRFGVSVAISGDTVAVGTRLNDIGENQNQGAVYIFERNEGGPDNWGEVKRLLASDGQAGDQFGASVAISGDTLVVGADFDEVGDTQDQGSAYIFERNRGGQNNWGEAKKIVASDGEILDSFGFSVAISGNTVVVGANRARGEEFNQGAAYVFDRDRGGEDNWGEVKKLTASDGEEGDQFGFSVAISGDTIVVGDKFDDVGQGVNQGTASVFDRDLGGEDNWGEARRLTASDGRGGDFFGHSVSINSDTIVVGAITADVGISPDQGAAYVFERDRGGEDNWGETKKLITSDGQEGDLSGSSVSISGDTIAVGVIRKDIETHFNQGAAYVFERDRGGADNWGEIDKLAASVGEEGDEFGNAVSIDGDTIVAGSHLSNVGAGEDQGAASVFTLNSAPTIIPARISLEQDTPIRATIATVDDAATPAGDLIVEVLSVPEGFFINGIKNENGEVSAFIGVLCSASLGENAFGLRVTDADGETSTANLIIEVTPETEPPTISCPSGGLVAVNQPDATSVIINYGQPSVQDNCSTPVIVCNPPSGSAFPVGRNTVTCTATDAAGNSAQCSFIVNIFNACIQDDSNSKRTLLFNSFTGDYLFCVDGRVVSGRGSLTKKGNTYTLVHNTADRRVQATLDTGMNRGSASLQSPPGSPALSLTDRDTRNNTCRCFLI